MRTRTVVALLAVVSAAVLAAATLGRQPLQRLAHSLQTMAGHNFSSVPTVEKLCRVSLLDGLVEALMVPKTWSAESCAAYASKSGGERYALGCVRHNAAAADLGPSAAVRPQIERAQPPARNCGW